MRKGITSNRRRDFVPRCEPTRGECKQRKHIRLILLGSPEVRCWAEPRYALSFYLYYSFEHRLSTTNYHFHIPGNHQSLNMAAPMDERINVPIDDPNADTEW